MNVTCADVSLIFLCPLKKMFLKLGGFPGFKKCISYPWLALLYRGFDVYGVHLFVRCKNKNTFLNGGNEVLNIII